MPDEIGQEPQIKPGQEPAILTTGAAPDAADDPQDGNERKYGEDYVKRLRAENAKHRTEANELSTRLKALEDATKSEAERLAEKAALADRLGPELEEAKKVIESLEKALLAEVEAQQKALPDELMALLPEGSASAQLDWIRKAKAAADKLKPPTQASQLPASGGRSPGQPTTKQEFTEEEKRQHARIAAQRF